MTFAELSKLYRIKCRAEECERRLADLHLQRKCQSPLFDGMPKNKSTSSRVEKLALEIVEVESALLDLRCRYFEERARLERYISAIPDSRLRLIFTARFVEGLTWEDVARYVGGSTTEYGARQLCYRYLRGQE